MHRHDAVLNRFNCVLLSSWRGRSKPLCSATAVSIIFSRKDKMIKTPQVVPHITRMTRIGFSSGALVYHPEQPMFSYPTNALGGPFKPSFGLSGRAAKP